MNDSIIKTICKSIVAVVGANLLGILLEFLLLMVFGWLMDFGLLWFLIIGPLLLPIITCVPVGLTVFLTKLFNNRIAGIVFGLLISVWLIITTIEFWVFLFQFDVSDSDWFKAIAITLTMVCDIIASFYVPFELQE